MDDVKASGSWFMVPAPPLLRLAAYLIDLAIVAALSPLVVRFLTLFFAPLIWMPGGEPSLSLMALILLFWPLLMLYFVVSEASAAQATLGKHLLGIQVITVDGQRITLWKSLYRNAAKVLTDIPYGLGSLLMLFSKRHRPCTTGWRARWSCDRNGG